MDTMAEIRRGRGIERASDSLANTVYTGEDGSTPAKTATPPVRIPPEAFLSLGQLTTAIASGDRETALALLSELQKMLGPA